MYITCKAIWDAGITKDRVGCCGSCHIGDEDFDMGLIEIYEDDIGLSDRMVRVGEICCAVSHALDELPNKQDVLRKIWESEQ